MRARAAAVVLTAWLLGAWVLPGAALAQSESTTPTTVPAAPVAGSDVFETSNIGDIGTLAADCIGCIAAWGLWDLGSQIRGVRESRTDEVVNRIHVHGSIIKALNDTCAGDWRAGESAENFSKTKFFTSQWQTHDNQYAQGGQSAWGNAGAHEWDEDGVFWGAGQNGETDICKTF